MVDVIAAADSQYDAILLDTDNGPKAFTTFTNKRLYSPEGLEKVRRALRPGGVLALWSTFRDVTFTARLRSVGFDATAKRVLAGDGTQRRHVIWLARRLTDDVAETASVDVVLSGPVDRRHPLSLSLNPHGRSGRGAGEACAGRPLTRPDPAPGPVGAQQAADHVAHQAVDGRSIAVRARVAIEVRAQTHPAVDVRERIQLTDGRFDLGGVEPVHERRAMKTATAAAGVLEENAA